MTIKLILIKIQKRATAIIVGILLTCFIAFNFSCAPKAAPYANGPVMSKKNITKTFHPILEFMEVKPGMAFADVGASSGAFTVMMTTLMDKSKIYLYSRHRHVRS